MVRSCGCDAAVGCGDRPVRRTNPREPGGIEARHEQFGMYTGYVVTHNQL